MEFLSDYGLFVAKAATLIVCLIIVLSILMAFRQREHRSEKGHIEVTKLNERFENMAETLKHAALPPEELKRELKADKKKRKQEKAAAKKAAKQQSSRESKSDVENIKTSDNDKTLVDTDSAQADEDQSDRNPASNSGESISENISENKSDDKKRLFVLNFDGDIKAQATEHLREEITTVLTLAKPTDEVVLRLESPGGVVHLYGLAASQLSRIKNKKIPLTICVDKVAASGGYMMACVGDKILAAPFAVLGSIGVMAEVPNFNRLLKKAEIDYDVYTAGEFKRTVTRFGENTEKGKQKFKDELQDVHVLFKEFINENRPSVDIDAVATGEAWYGRRALERKLVDELITSDEYILGQQEQADIFEIEFVAKKSLQEKLGLSIQGAIEQALTKVLDRIQYSRFFP